MDELTPEDREEVASEPRLWVRISRTCNNHCEFCLDSDVQDGTFVPADEVRSEIDRGLEGGATRLILSGGEASIHPEFLDLVSYGKAKGFRHVQTITNGRMFAYHRFAAKAVEAGLDEVTFSLHGHTPDLGDAMTGVPGSFAQTIAGIRNVVATGRCIVSGDVVVNRRNVAHLRQILDLFVSLGVREFDILMVVPFGRASPGESGGDLLLDPAADLASLRDALQMARTPGIHVWTNRLAPALLEGFEDLIQDPHKLYDEVRGRRELLEDLARGRKMRCAGPRCSHCFIHGLCSSMRESVRDLGRGVPGILRVVAGTARPHRAAMDLAARDRRVVWIEARDTDAAVEAARGLGGRDLWLAIRDPSGLVRAVGSGALRQPARLMLGDERSLAAIDEIETREVLVAVNRSTASWLAGNGPGRPGRLLLSYEPAGSVREAAARDVDLGRTLPGLRADGHVNIPPCLSGRRSVTYEDPFDLAVLGKDGRVDPDAFGDHFIRWKYRDKSLRCRGCRLDRRCRGIHINLARHAGLGILSPVA